MIKQVCTMAGLLLAGIAGAQTEKGNGLISGDVSVDYSRPSVQPGNAQYSWRTGLNVTAGRFVADKWLVGATAWGRWGLGKSENSVPVGQVLRVFTESNTSVDGYITPFVRRYWQFSPVQVFAGVGLSVGVNDVWRDGWKFDGASQEYGRTKLHNNSINVSPYVDAGVNYFVTKRLALQLSASTRSLPLNVATLNTGLVYWTGPDRKADPQEVRENMQTNRGNWIVEGGFSVSGMSSTNLPDNTVNQASSRTFSISPSVGYFISKNNLLGISIPFMVNTYDNSGQNPPFSVNSSYLSVGVSPYFQHYWTSTRLTPYTRVNATYNVSRAKPNNSDISYMYASAALSVGLAYMAGKRFIIETSFPDPSLTYAWINGSQTANTSWDTSLSAGLSGNFAVRYVLTRPN